MAYSDFDLRLLVQQFGLTIEEVNAPIANGETNITDFLKMTIQENLPLATAIDTEKARSELLIFPVLLEVKRTYARPLSIFSGKEFTVEKDLGLSGNPDFLVSLSSYQYFISAPIITLVEAKNQNINSGLGQCGAEMVAAQKFNETNNQSIKSIYGCVTTGVLWKFLCLHEQTLYIYNEEVPLKPLDRLVGIFLEILRLLD